MSCKTILPVIGALRDPIAKKMRDFWKRGQFRAPSLHMHSLKSIDLILELPLVVTADSHKCNALVSAYWPVGITLHHTSD